MLEAIEPPLPPTPEDQELRTRKRGDLHGAEAMSNGVEQGIEHGFQNHAIRSDGVRVDGPQYGSGAHAPAEEEDVVMR